MAGKFSDICIEPVNSSLEFANKEQNSLMCTDIRGYITWYIFMDMTAPNIENIASY